MMADEEYLTQLERDNQTMSEKLQDYESQQEAILSEEERNMVKWQLDVREDLEVLEHVIKGDKIGIDKKGYQYWIPATEDAFDSQGQLIERGTRILNAKGVSAIMEELQVRLRKIFTLSYYEPEDIDLRVKQFATYFRDFFYENFLEFGLDIAERARYYKPIFWRVVDLVEANYRRALRGGERNSLRSRTSVHQTEPIYSGQYNQPDPGLGRLNPFRRK